MTDRSGSSWGVLSRALAVCLILSVTLPGFSTAQVAPPTAAPQEFGLIGSYGQDNAAVPPIGSPSLDNAAAPPVASPVQDNAAAPPAPGPIGVTAPETAVEVGLLERTHLRLERGIFERVIRLDNFFGNVKTEGLQPPDYQLRWRNSLRVEEGGHVKYRTTVHGSFILPKISKRVRLTISGETEPEPFTSKLPEDPGYPGFDRTLANTRVVNTELRYGVIRTPSTEVFLGAGVRVKYPLESFVRSRGQYFLRIGEANLLRFAETLFWKNTDGFGETTEIDFARKLGRKAVLRWANSGTVTEEGPGMEFATELSLLRELSPRSAITFGGGLAGHTRPDAVVDTYRVFTRYRRNFLRPWLFYELEPEITWPRDDAGAYTSTYAFTFRVEVVFQGTAAMGEKKPVTPLSGRPDPKLVSIVPSVASGGYALGPSPAMH